MERLLSQYRFCFLVFVGVFRGFCWCFVVFCVGVLLFWGWCGVFCLLFFCCILFFIFRFGAWLGLYYLIEVLYIFINIQKGLFKLKISIIVERRGSFVLLYNWFTSYLN